MADPTNIQYNSTSANFGIMTAELVTALKTAAAKAQRINAAALEVTAGSTPVNLEAVGSGFEVANGKGGDFMTYIGSIASALNDAGLQGWLSKLDRGG